MQLNNSISLDQKYLETHLYIMYTVYNIYLIIYIYVTETKIILIDHQMMRLYFIQKLQNQYHRVMSVFLKAYQMDLHLWKFHGLQ